MTKIWHRVHPTFTCDMLDVAQAWGTQGEYELVATVSSPPNNWKDEGEWAFFKTNSIDTPWTDNEEVTAIREQIRSTSVGDIIETEDGSLKVVDSLGFKVLSLEEKNEEQNLLQSKNCSVF